MKLQEIFPPTSYSESEADKVVYARDASGIEGSCTAVVWPRTKEQIHHLILYCRRTSHKLTIRGAATGTFGGAVPSHSIVVDMCKMDTVREKTTDLVHVEAGMTLAALNKALGKKVFPVQPLEHPVCTIGGMIAMNTLGLDSYEGTIAEWIEELEVIDGAGKHMLVHGPGMQNFIGKEGSTGIILSAKLRILKRPREKTVSLFEFNTLTALMEKVKQLDNHPSVLAIEYFDDISSRMLKIGNALHVLVEFSDQTGTLKEPEEIRKVNEMKEQLRHLLVQHRYTKNDDPKIPLKNMAKFLHWLRTNSIPCYGHISRRTLHPCFRDGSKIPEEMCGVVLKLEGENIGEYGVGVKRKALLSKQRREKLLVLKNQYDPHRILNGGVVVD